MTFTRDSTPPLYTSTSLPRNRGEHCALCIYINESSLRIQEGKLRHKKTHIPGHPVVSKRVEEKFLDLPGLSFPHVWKETVHPLSRGARRMNTTILTITIRVNTCQEFTPHHNPRGPLLRSQLPFRNLPGSATYSPRIKSSPLSHFTNKALLVHSQAHTLTFSLWLSHATTADLSTCDRDCVTHQHIYSRTLNSESLLTPEPEAYRDEVTCLCKFMQVGRSKQAPSRRSIRAP